MRRFGFLIVALAAIAMFFSPSQRERTGQAVVPPSDKVSAGAAPGEAGGDRVNTVAEDVKDVNSPLAPPTARLPVVKASAEPVAAAPEAGAKATVATEAGKVAALEPAMSPNGPPAAAPVPAETASAEPAEEPLTGRELVTAAQSELARLLCYDGRIDGKWGRQSRAAAAYFAERTGVPVEGEDPSQDLLTALRAAPDEACELTEAKIEAEGTVNSVKAEEKAPPPVLTDRDLAYLPPWMREEKLQKAEAAAAAPDADGEPPTASAPEVQPVEAKPAPKRVRAVRRRPERRWKYVATRPRRNWQPEGWPRSGH
jgi:peptidoglycan hydrolase-like protein with peptidoglycan-binding domain